MGNYCFGIDVGGTTVKCGLFGKDGSLIEKWEIPTRVGEDGSDILPDVAQTILDKISEMGIDKKEVEGIGIGIPGPVNEKGEVPVAVNLHWKYKAVAGEVSALTGIPTVAANDANVAALGEAWKGAGTGARNLLMVTLGTGVGGGVIVGGRIVYGLHGAGGEIGHACVDPDEEEYCNCGKRGCLEQYASATGMCRLAAQELQNTDEDSVLRPLYREDRLTAKDLADAFKEGDAVAVRVMDRCCRILGQMLGCFCAVIDPEYIVIGGGVSRTGKPLTDLLEKYYKIYAFPQMRDTPIVIAELGNNAGIFGAARMVMKD